MNRRSSRRWMLLPLAFTLTLPACGSDAGLTDQTWTLTEVGGVPAVETAVATLTFSDGTVAGNTGCNDFRTNYEEAGSSVVIDPVVAATLKACEPDLMAQETALFEAFAATAELRISGTELQLLDDSEATLARYSSESE